MTDDIVPIDAAPTRRSGAITNIAAPRLQAEFIKAARAAMGQPDLVEAWQYVGKHIKITFNGDRDPVVGVLTEINSHPSADSAYLILDRDKRTRYALNSIQSIELVETTMPRPGFDELQ